MRSQVASRTNKHEEDTTMDRTAASRQAQISKRRAAAAIGSCLLTNANESYNERLSNYLLKKRIVSKIQQKREEETKR